MYLCIDIGNTDLKFGVFAQRNLQTHGRGLVALQNLLEEVVIERALISAVASSAAAEKLLQKKNIAYQFLSSPIQLPFQVIYETPDTLGVDRLALVAGALPLANQKNCLVISCGTCITYNFLTAEKIFIGGAIAPGLAMRLRAMHEFTHGLPLATWDGKAIPPRTGKNTHTSLLSGAVLGMAAELNEAISDYSLRYPELEIIVTGGDAVAFVPLLKNNIFARPTLLLEGLNEILLYAGVVS